MIPKTIVENDLSGLEMIQSALDQLCEERFVEGIKSKHRSLYEIEQTTEMVEVYQHRVNIEVRALARFSESFIGDFSTDNNKCFNTSQRMFGKMRCTLAGMKKAFRKTTPSDRTQLPDGVDPPMLYDKSPLGHGDYTPDIFGLESYPQQVQRLYEAFKKLFETCSTAIALSTNMILMEESARNDLVQLRQIYKSSCDIMMSGFKAVEMFSGAVIQLPHNRLEELRKKAGSEDNIEFLKNGYHALDKKEMSQYVIIKCLREAQSNGLTEVEGLYWRDNPKKGLEVRYVVENFDKVPDVMGQSGKLSSIVVVEFLKWCGVPEDKEKDLYEHYFRPKYQMRGKCMVLGWNTISGRRKELKDLGDTDEKLARDFEARLEAMKAAQQAAGEPAVMLQSGNTQPSQLNFI